MPYRKRSRSARGSRRGRSNSKPNMRKRRQIKKVSWKRKVVNRMADQVSNKTPCKYDRQTSGLPFNITAGTLFFSDISNVNGLLTASGFGTHGPLPNVRLQNIIDLRGWHYDVMFKNNSLTDPMIYHIALVRSTRTDSQTMSLVDFFREHNTSRDLDFNAPLFGQQYNVLKLNPDVCDILMHRSAFVSRAASANISNGATSQINYKRMKGYIPFKKPMIFDDDGAGPQNPRPVFFISWCAPPASWSSSPMDKVADIGTAFWNIVTVFREGQSGK